MLVPSFKKFILLAVVGVVMTLASTASAMCVYNFTDKEAIAWFRCGFTCLNKWTVEPNGSSQCRPATKGHLEAGFYWNDFGFLENVVNLSVDPHGWVEMRTIGFGDVQVCAYRQDGSQGECQRYDPSETVDPNDGDGPT